MVVLAFGIRLSLPALLLWTPLGLPYSSAMICSLCSPLDKRMEMELRWSYGALQLYTLLIFVSTYRAGCMCVCFAVHVPTDTLTNVLGLNFSSTPNNLEQDHAIVCTDHLYYRL